MQEYTHVSHTNTGPTYAFMYFSRRDCGYISIDLFWFLNAYLLDVWLICFFIICLS